MLIVSNELIIGLFPTLVSKYFYLTLKRCDYRIIKTTFIPERPPVVVFHVCNVCSWNYKLSGYRFIAFQSLIR